MTEAGSGAARPQDRLGGFLGGPEPVDGLVGFGLRAVESALAIMSLTIRVAADRRGGDGAGADGIDTDAGRGVFESGAAGESDHSVLGGVVGGTAGDADEPAE
jgi:hypothetical protein